jgi:hypothetical protein
MADDGDLRAHQQTYNGVMKLLLWGAVGCALLACIAIWLIA